jgi:alanyl-tRNA synthetase
LLTDLICMKIHFQSAAEIRQAYLDYFKAQGHKIVPSSSLLPTSPNLLFTNSGMNQFVPYFLDERKPTHTRVADTQKCIRAGGKHNDLEDVGFDGYHHTFFEMLGNWSFGDYFKKEAIAWAWELLTKVWGFPKERLYATVYKPGPNDPADFDQEAYDLWSKVFEAEGMDPKVHICFGNKKDNFWMMGDTGPCGPCTELHMDLTPEGDTQGKLVNADSPWCIELWNLVFIQFNAEPNGQFSALPARHVDTGMGFERIAGILATTKNFTEFSRPPSNYDSDLFQEIFQTISELSGATYGYTLPETKDRSQLTAQQSQDCIFRVLGDHIRTLSFSIADGILPGNDGRSYVLRRILRRAVLFGKRLNLKPGFLSKLAKPLIAKLSPVFPELQTQERVILKVLENEEMAFERTLDRGLQWMNQYLKDNQATKQLSGEQAFKLYDTYGFPLDLTQIIAEENGFTVDSSGFEVEMEAQRERARQAQQKTIIQLASHAAEPTAFVGYDRQHQAQFEAPWIGLGDCEGKPYAVLASSPFYAEMGGQLGDQGTMTVDGEVYQILDTRKDGNGHFLHFLDRSPSGFELGKIVLLEVDTSHRRAIERHHTATHLLHWALRKVLGPHVGQAGSFVGPHYLRFDFSHFEALSPAQLTEIEALIQSKILENALVQWAEVPFSEKPEDVLAFFGEKYGEKVRIVDVGGFSKELCGGTHVESTGEIGLFRITSEGAIAAGVRRIEAVAGLSAYQVQFTQNQWIKEMAHHLSCPTQDLMERFHQALEEKSALEKKLKRFEEKALSDLAKELSGKAQPAHGLQWVVQVVPCLKPDELKGLAFQVGKGLPQGVVVLASPNAPQVHCVAYASMEAITKGYKANALIKTLTQALDGKGGGKDDFAMGGGKFTADLMPLMQQLMV